MSERRELLSVSLVDSSHFGEDLGDLEIIGKGEDWSYKNYLLNDGEGILTALHQLRSKSRNDERLLLGDFVGFDESYAILIYM